MIKKKVLIVGGFPKSGKRIFGGIVTSCKVLLNSSFSTRFNVKTIDSTQKSNPMPNIVIRLFYAMVRTLFFSIKLIYDRPHVIILFASIKTSIIEKGLMSWLAFFLRIPVLMFQRWSNFKSGKKF